MAVPPVTYVTPQGEYTQDFERYRSEFERNVQEEGGIPTDVGAGEIEIIPRPGLTAPPPTLTADPYAAFKVAFTAAYGREITQRELNNPVGELNDILDGRPGLTRLLPIERQYTLDAKVLSDLSNEDLNPILGYILNRDPKGLLNFSADRLAQFDIPSITGFYQVMSQVDPDNQLTKDLADTIQRVSGQSPTPGPPPQPGAPPATPPLGSVSGPPPITPGAPAASPTGGVAGPSPSGAPATTAPPYAGAGQYAIPRAEALKLPTDIASRSALEQYYTMLGYGNVATPQAAPAAPRGAPPSTTFPDFSTWQVQNPGKTYDDYFAARSAATPAGGVGGRLSDIPVDENGVPIPYDLGFGPPPAMPPPSPPPPYEAPPGRRWDYRVTWSDVGGTTVQWTLVDADTPGSWSPENPFATQGGTAALEWERKFGALATPSAGGAGPRPLTPEEQAQAAANLQYTNAQIAALEARVRNDEAQLAEAKAARQFSEQIAIQDRLDKARADLQNFTLQRDQLVQRQAEFGAELTQRQAEFGATATGMVGGQPTLTREVARQQADLANKRQQADNAVNAANIALRQGDQAEARRQFDIAQTLRAEIDRGQLALSTRAQGLSEELGRGQLGLAGRAQTEAEAQGAFGRGLQTAQFQREVQQSPSSFTQRAYAARGQAAPPETGVTISALPQAAGVSTARLASAGFATTQPPLTAGEIKANVGPGLAKALGGKAPGQFYSTVPRLSAQRYGQLMPSEREEYRAAALASGTSPQDLEEEIRRRSQTGTPPSVVATMVRRAPRKSLF